MPTLRLTARASSSHRPWLARITGMHEKFVFARRFLRGDESGLTPLGRTGEVVWEVDEAGLYEIASVPFLHMSPTSGDVVAVSKDDQGELRFDKVVKKGGRWVSVYNWFPQKAAKASKKKPAKKAKKKKR